MKTGKKRCLFDLLLHLNPLTPKSDQIGYCQKLINPYGFLIVLDQTTFHEKLRNDSQKVLIVKHISSLSTKTVSGLMCGE